MAEPAEALTFDVSTTVDDYRDFFIFVGRTRRSLFLQALLFLGLAIWFFVMAFSMGVLTAAFEPKAAPALQNYVTAGWRTDLANLGPWILGGTVALYLANLLVFYPQQARRIAIGLMAGYPEIANNDPTKKMTTRMHMTTQKIVAETRDQRVAVAWVLVRRLVETRRHVFLMTSRTTAFVIPKTSLGKANASGLVAFASDRLAESRD